MALPRETGGNVPGKRLRVKRTPPKRPVGVFAEPPTRDPVERIQTQQTRHLARAVLKVEKKAPARPLTRHEVATAFATPTGREVVKHAHRVAYAEAVKAANDAENAADKPGTYSLLGLVKFPTGTEVSNYWEQKLHDKRVSLPAPLRAASEVGLNVIKEAIDIPAQAIPSTAHLLKDAVTDPKKALVEDIAQPTIETLKHPTKHPLSLVLLGRGAEAAVGRGAGAVARSGAAGKTLKEAASTVRDPLRLSGDLTEPRSYSRDVIEKGAQVLGEKRKQRKGIDPNQATGKQLVRKLRNRVDESVDVTEGLRRRNRQEVASTHDAEQPKHGKEAVPLIVEGTVRSRATLRGDLEAELARLQEAHAGLETKAERAQNLDQQAQVRSLLANRKFLADPAPAFGAARSYLDRHSETTDELVNLGYLTAEQVDRARLIPYAVRHMGARWDPETHDLAIDGEPLTNAAIREHMAPSLELGDVGFLTHRLSPRNAYYVSSESRPVHYGQRTGKAIEKGTYDASPDALAQQAVRSQGLVDAIKGVNRTINEFGLKKSDGKYFKNWQEAQQFAEEIRQNHGPDLVPLRIAPLQTSRLLIQNGKTVAVPGRTPNVRTIKETLSPESIREHLEALPQRLKDAANEGDGEAVLIPRSVHKRLVEHAQKTQSTTFDKAFQVGTGQFRQTVLPLSPRWLFGNVAEAAMRLAAVGAVSVRTGGRLLSALREVDPEAAAAFEARALSGTHFSSVKRQQLHRSASQFDSTALEGTAHLAGRAAASLPGRVLLRAWHAYRDDVAFKFNRWFETQTQKAAIGKLARDQVRELGHSWIGALRMGDDAIKDVAEGLQNTDAQIRYARYVDRVLGRYSKLGPTERRLMSDYAPFMAWYRNALVFTARLPIDHPIKTALLTEAYNSSAESRAEQGLGEFLPGDSRLPRFLQGSLPVGEGKMRLEAFTPFGAFSDPLGTPADLILPQGRTIMNAAQGKDWKGDPLTRGGGDPELGTEAEAILSAIAAGFIPGVAAIGRVRKNGGEAFANPLHPVGRGTHGSSTWGAAGGSSAHDSGWGTAGGSGGSSGWGAAGG